MLKCFQDKQNSSFSDIMTDDIIVIVVMWSMIWMFLENAFIKVNSHFVNS